MNVKFPLNPQKDDPSIAESAIKNIEGIDARKDSNMIKLSLFILGYSDFGILRLNMDLNKKVMMVLFV